MIRPLSATITCLVGSLLFAAMGWAAPESPAVLLDRAVHFTSPDGSDLTVAAGTYRVEQSAETHLRLVANPPQPAIEIQATATTHEETVASPLALAIAAEDQEDEIHLVLLLPGGQGLDATGSFSGTRSRAIASALGRVQVQTAVVQSKVTPSPMLRVPAAAAAITANPPLKALAASSPGKWITWNYLAMNHPEIVAQALAEVQAGTRPLATMSGLASRPELTEMLKTNWSAEAAQITTARNAAMRQARITTRGGLSAATTLAPSSAQATLTPTSPTTTLSPPHTTAHVPIMLPPRNLGSVWAGSRTGTLVSITALEDGYVEGRLNLNATNRHFYILKAVAYTGEVVDGTFAVSLTKSGGKYEDVVLDPANPPAQISKAGFVAIQAKKGQRIDFTVGFAPVGLGMTPVGDNEATLQLSGATWMRTVSIRARFEGINLGIMAFAEQGHADTLTNQVVEMPIIVTNAATRAWAGTLTAAQLPPGVTMDPLSVSFPGQGTQRHLARFHVSDAAQDGPAQPIVVQVYGAEQLRLVNLSMSIYHPWIAWCFGYECGGSDRRIPGIPYEHGPEMASGNLGVHNVHLWIKDDGQWWWEISTYNEKAIDIGGSDFYVTVWFNANQSVKDRIDAHIGPLTIMQMYSHQRADPWIHYNFLAAAKAGVTFHYSER